MPSTPAWLPGGGNVSSGVSTDEGGTKLTKRFGVCSASTMLLPLTTIPSGACRSAIRASTWPSAARCSIDPPTGSVTHRLPSGSASRSSGLRSVCASFGSDASGCDEGHEESPAVGGDGAAVAVLVDVAVGVGSLVGADAGGAAPPSDPVNPSRTTAAAVVANVNDLRPSAATPGQRILTQERHTATALINSTAAARTPASPPTWPGPH